MSKAGNTLVAVAGIAFVAISASAEMPKVLKGTWVLDAEATQDYVKTSPKWKAEDETYLPRIMKRMSQMAYEFTDEAMVVSMRGKKQALPVSLKESAPGKHVFEGTIRDKTITMTVTFVKDGTINIRSSVTDDMHYYLWKRGPLPGSDGPTDAQLATEVMKDALRDGAGKPTDE